MTRGVKRCVFLGFKKETKGYILFDSKTKELFLSRHVVVYETIYPFKHVVTSPYTSPFKPLYLKLTYLISFLLLFYILLFIPQCPKPHLLVLILLTPFLRPHLLNQQTTIPTLLHLSHSRTLNWYTIPSARFFTPSLFLLNLLRSKGPLGPGRLLSNYKILSTCHQDS